MNTNRQIDLTPLMAIAQVIQNVCAAPAIERKQLKSIHYAAAMLEYLANAAFEQFDLPEGAHHG